MKRSIPLLLLVLTVLRGGLPVVGRSSIPSPDRVFRARTEGGRATRDLEHDRPRVRSARLAPRRSSSDRRRPGVPAVHGRLPRPELDRQSDRRAAGARRRRSRRQPRSGGSGAAAGPRRHLCLASHSAPSGHDRRPRYLRRPDAAARRSCSPPSTTCASAARRGALSCLAGHYPRPASPSQDYFFPAVRGYFADPAIALAIFAVPQDLSPDAQPDGARRRRGGQHARGAVPCHIRDRHFRERTLDISDDFLQRKIPEIYAANGLPPAADLVAGVPVHQPRPAPAVGGAAARDHRHFGRATAAGTARFAASRTRRR